MKAAVLYEPGRLVVEEVPVPQIGDDEVLVQIKTTAICGTDISIYKGKIIPASYPVIQGHESAGIIAETGKNVRRVKAGDHVIINPAIYCGECYCCLHGLSNLCLNGGLLGRDMPGTFAEYVAVPQNSLTLLPKEVSFDDASSLQSLATALRSWERMTLTPGDTAVVIGLGTPGLLHTRMAVLNGANTLAVTRSKWKLDIARAYGAQPVDPVKSDPVQAVMQATRGLGADLVIEAAGTSATTAQAIEMARPGGTVMFFGTVNTIENFNAYSVYYKELTLLGSRAMNRNGYEKAVALHSADKLDLSPLITHRFTLEDTANMFDMVYEGSEKSLRVVCTF